MRDLGGNRVQRGSLTVEKSAEEYTYKGAECRGIHLQRSKVHRDTLHRSKVQRDTL